MYCTATLPFLAVLLVNIVVAQWNPNHVSINEEHKHIEADSSWLDKRQQEVQRVSNPTTIRKLTIINFVVYVNCCLQEKGKSGNYAYTITQNGKKTDATLSAHDIGSEGFAESLFGRRSEKYHCTAETPGVSQCYDAQGRSVGKVVADKNGNTVVYNEKDVPIGTGSVKKIGPRSYEAVISKNLFIARLKDARSQACCREVSGHDCVESIKLANPSFSHPSSRDGDGTVHLTWPDCFDMGIDVTLPKGKNHEVEAVGEHRWKSVPSDSRKNVSIDRQALSTTRGSKLYYVLGLFQQGSYTPTNSELLEFWVSKRDPDRLLACQHAVVDYEIEGAKVKTNVLFEAATTANSIPNILKDKKCAAFERLQEERFQQEAHAFKKQTGGGNFLSGLNGFLNTVRG
ncbi:hypothetical protein GCK32_004559 [Trichostrongylus colubriformis]|uniref:Uncharacterized protein n=1 Tax=Trichostrongylus colubriformis TaxID=6319 RepID=A0AAN8IGL0_TRICO